jgi:hypothetical protein
MIKPRPASGVATLGWTYAFAWTAHVSDKQFGTARWLVVATTGPMPEWRMQDKLVDEIIQSAALDQLERARIVHSTQTGHLS